MAKEETKVEGAKSAPTDIQQLAELLADVLETRGNSTVKGGKPFVAPSQEEVAKMKKYTMAERAEEYWMGCDLANFPWPGIHVTSDLMIFMGHIQGENALKNHIAASVVNGVPTLKYESFSKPQ